MTMLNKLPDIRRPVTIGLTPRPTATHCDDCGARHVGLCEVLSDEELAGLSRFAQHITLPAGSVFIEEGEPANFVYNVNSGFIRLFKSLPDGRRHIIGFAGPGYFLGLAGSANIVSAETMEPVRLCRFTRAAMAQIFAEFPQLERKLLEVTIHELVLGQQQMLLLGRKTAMERIASFLLSWAAREALCAEGRLPRPGARLKLPISRTDLADHLGLTIETVSRSLSTLKRDGLIGIPNMREILLLRPQALSDIAEAAS
ncbi:MAG TPA: helix-turn-helix domain-containing protein [Acidocella sp.]|nr:helix-turn-helix domain-containing protein [Acidocella sp.]